VATDVVHFVTFGGSPLQSINQSINWYKTGYYTQHLLPAPALTDSTCLLVFTAQVWVWALMSELVCRWVTCWLNVVRG